MRKALAVFYALVDQKSALFKIFDLKARRFRGIFALFLCGSAAADQGKMGEKHRNVLL